MALPCFKNFPVGSTSFLRRPFKGSKENLMDDLGHMKKLESGVIYIYIHAYIPRHSISIWIFNYIYHMNQSNVGKYTIYIECLGT